MQQARFLRQIGDRASSVSGRRMIRTLTSQSYIISTQERVGAPSSARSIHSSLNDSSYFPLEQQYLYEEECDPRNYGYRVVSPVRSRQFTTASSAGTETIPQQPSLTTPQVDEYDFIMSSTSPVSDQQCANLQTGLGLTTSSVVDSLGQNSQFMQSDHISSIVTEEEAPVDGWETPGVHEVKTDVDDYDMALD